MVVKTRAELPVDLSSGGTSDNKIETRFAKDLLDSVSLASEGGGGDVPSSDENAYLVGNLGETGGAAEAVSFGDISDTIVESAVASAIEQVNANFYGGFATLSGPGNFYVGDGAYVITGYYIKNASGNDVTGGINLGLSNGGTELANSIAALNNIDYYYAVGDTFNSNVVPAGSTIFVDAASSWNGASISLTIYFMPIK